MWRISVVIAGLAAAVLAAPVAGQKRATAGPRFSWAACCVRSPVKTSTSLHSASCSHHSALRLSRGREAPSTGCRITASGSGGQWLFVVPSLDLVVAVIAADGDGLELFYDGVLPAITR